MYDIFIVMDREEITDYLPKKVFNGELKTGYYIMLKNKQIYSVDDYGRLVGSNKLSPEDAFVYINFTDYNKNESYNRLFAYLFPFIDDNSIYGIVDSYLAKLGFYNSAYSIYPATGLKYYAVVRLFSDRLVIELTDIDTMANNTCLRKIVIDMLGKSILTQKEISNNQIREIVIKLREQKLFAGVASTNVFFIINDYYIYQDTTLAKEVLAITNDYNRIFQPYRVVYDTRTRQQVLM